MSNPNHLENLPECPNCGKRMTTSTQFAAGVPMGSEWYCVDCGMKLPIVSDHDGLPYHPSFCQCDSCMKRKFEAIVRRLYAEG